ncbi:D-3-phosphoglycerate dehydrogenase [Paenibacillus sp. cl141a]|uniref:phosphoglycerate dehydrogenase n=1 Tax=Paenibacillus sp. cl141a TaxID=1761877 RepID=UPI0008D73195|nr:phosphoglycerate dehydrogenase [Paenibacillus sp. cl141a]SEK51028.1 D-3-phosphoglycerate dehydrogenase [Paenibacillus sp. cl141a]
MKAKKVLVTATNYSQLCADAKRLLENHGCEIIENRFGRPLTFEELKEVVGSVDGVIAGVDTWNEEIFKLAPQLQGIARFGVGVDNIDLEAARKYGIQVTNVPRGNANAVAELAIGLMISARRHIPALDRSTKNGGWERFVGSELAGGTIGLLGFGNIAQLTAKKLKGFDVEIIAYDKYPDTVKASEYGVTMTTFEHVLAHSDIVSMHLPSLKETHHIMNDKAFARMKPSAIFINTARGAVVDEQALTRALSSGVIAGAAIDVYESEPVSADHPILQIGNLVTTPHTAAETFETYTRVSMITAQALLDIFEGREPQNVLTAKG